MENLRKFNYAAFPKTIFRMNIFDNFGEKYSFEALKNLRKKSTVKYLVFFRLATFFEISIWLDFSPFRYS